MKPQGLSNSLWSAANLQDAARAVEEPVVLSARCIAKRNAHHLKPELLGNRGMGQSCRLARPSVRALAAGSSLHHT